MRGKRLQAALRLEKGPAYQDNDLVLSEDDGRPWTPNRFSAQWHKAMRAAGPERPLPRSSPHPRDACSLRQGIHPKVVSERLGHSTVSITLDTYSPRHAGHAGRGGGDGWTALSKAAMGAARHGSELKRNWHQTGTKTGRARLADLSEAASTDSKSTCKSGGGGGIRTHERVAPLAVFKTAAFDLSATPPRG